MSQNKNKKKNKQNKMVDVHKGMFGEKKGKEGNYITIF